jgi:hypothetical protein
MQIREARRQAVPEILKDLPAISITSRSKEIRSSMAFTRLSIFQSITPA